MLSPAEASAVAADGAGLCGARDLPPGWEGGPVQREHTVLWPWAQKSEAGSSELGMKRNFLLQAKRTAEG